MFILLLFASEFAAQGGVKQKKLSGYFIVTIGIFYFSPNRKSPHNKKEF